MSFGPFPRQLTLLSAQGTLITMLVAPTPVASASAGSISSDTFAFERAPSVHGAVLFWTAPIPAINTGIT